MDRPPHNESFGCPCENGPRHGRAPCSAHGDRSWKDGEIAARRLRDGSVRGIILATRLALAPGLLGCSPAPSAERRSRLERWASLLERDPHRLIGLLRPSWAAGDDIAPMVASPSAIDLAWADPVFRVTGLGGRSRGDVKSFFQLSNAELDRIASGSWRVPLRPAWQTAARIRNVADPRAEKLLLVGVMVMIAGVVGAAQWLG
jgi:hypothetical protein